MMERLSVFGEKPRKLKGVGGVLDRLQGIQAVLLNDLLQAILCHSRDIFSQKSFNLDQ